MAQTDGLSLSLDELRCLFPLIKAAEGGMNRAERQILLMIEKYLYAHLSIAEVEALLEENQDRKGGGSYGQG